MVILRPQPGADRTAIKARALGLTPVVAPIFAVEAVAWQPPPSAGIVAVMLTSAHAPRLGGPDLDAFLALPCYAVGPATAAAARARGFRDVRTGPSDGAALIGRMAGDGVAAAFHPCGRDRIALEHPQVALVRRVVYASRALSSLHSDAMRALAGDAWVLIHSSRAAAHFAALATRAGLDRGRIGLVAISPAAAAAAGDGWRTTASAHTPHDEALLELAAKLCQTGFDDGRKQDGRA